MDGDAVPRPAIAPLPERAARFPIDRKNTAPPTRARYEYQDELAAVIVLRALTSGDLEGVLVERATDLALLPSGEQAELVSIKHREQTQRNNPSWSINDLVRDVLPGLYANWVACDRLCRVAFATNAGFFGVSYDLAQACDHDGRDRPAFPPTAVQKLRKRLGVSESEAEAFLSALTLEGEHPGRMHITDTGITAARDLLEVHRPGSSADAETVYQELCELIRDRSTDRPIRPNSAGTYLAATISATRRNRANLREDRQYLPGDDLLDFLLRVHDRAEAATRSTQRPLRWEADPAFVGRTEALAEIDRYLRPGANRMCAPLVIHGSPGCGKTALALQYAATRAAEFHPIRIDGENHANIAAELDALRQVGNTGTRLGATADLPGPVAPVLPPNSALLLIIDGVLDPKTLSGLVPSSSLCRVIITANGRATAPGWNTMELSTWSREESREYVRHTLPDAELDDADALAAGLHDHPLAISQATAYCRSTGRTITDYLRRFTAHPAHMLSREPAPGHPNLITTTTTDLLLTEAHKQAPAALDLARAFALLAAVGLPQEQLHTRLVHPSLLAPKLPKPAKPKRRWSRKNTRQTPGSTAFDPKTMQVAEAGPAIKALDNPDTMDDAIDALVRLSLLRRDASGLSMHPLVALVIREATPDPRAALALAFSWSLDGADQLGEGDFDRDLNRLSHLHALTSAAVRLDLRGIAVLACCHMLSVYLMRLPTGAYTTQDASRYLELYDLAARGYVLAIEQLSWPNANGQMYVAMCSAYARVLTRKGAITAPFGIFSNLVRIGVEHRIARLVATSLMHLADIAESHPKAQLKSGVDAAVAQAEQLDDGSVLAAIGYVKALRHRFEGRPRDAIVECERALALAEASGPSYGDLTETLLEEYAFAARDAGDGYTTASLSERRLELIRQQRGLGPDRSSIKDLCHAAAGALDTGNLFRAKQLLGQAQVLAEQGFQEDIGIEAMLLSLRGRTEVDSGAWQKGEDALRRAIELQERPDCPPIGGLAGDHFNRSLAQVMLGNRTAAVQSAQRALDLDLIQYPERHSQVILDYHNLAEITTVANADTNLNDLVAEFQRATGHSGIPLVQGSHPNGHPWWNGIALGKVRASAEMAEAIAAARQLLNDGGREVLDDYPFVNEMRLTVLNPLGVVTIRADGAGWFIVEILQSLFHQRTVFVDPEAVLRNLDAEGDADTAGREDARPRP